MSLIVEEISFYEAIERIDEGMEEYDIEEGGEISKIYWVDTHNNKEIILDIFAPTFRLTDEIIHERENLSEIWGEGKGWGKKARKLVIEFGNPVDRIETYISPDGVIAVATTKRF